MYTRGLGGAVGDEVAAELAGVADGVLDSLRDRLGCSISLRGNKLTLDGEGERVAEEQFFYDPAQLART